MRHGWTGLLQICCIAAAFGCAGARSPRPPQVGTWVELQFRGAALPARRAGGAPWHMSEGSSSSAFLGGLLGLAVGYPDVGLALGSALSSEPSPQAPEPFVVLKIEGDTYRVSPAGRTLAPRWVQPIAIPLHRYSTDTTVILQILDAVDQGVIGQKSYVLADLLLPGARTLTDLGEAASLDIEVRHHAPRQRTVFELYVSGEHSIESLKNGADSRWMPIPVWNGDRITVAATGEICPSRRAACFGPSGAEPGRWASYNYSTFAETPHASLVGLLPQQPLAIGSHGTFIAEQSGFLLLFLNDTDTGNNSGGLDVSVTIEPSLP